ncbi:hypothetical protein L1987_46519 [Smallanthus sonchifolius]|uniref:Uncharacterized protein n=1 Tax=Smallanthus sonchifolius TaxID=185202 RepID=A0ACB9G034_9ASTR|nr:hypothetical protein L1987_46519 [Smallanthus sonchifolius]
MEITFYIKMVDAEDIQPLVSDNGTETIKDITHQMQQFNKWRTFLMQQPCLISHKCRMCTSRFFNSV